MSQNLDFAAINSSHTELIVTAVRILDATVHYFESPHIGLEHLMASSAIPILFPWEEIEGEAYWDGGIAVNTPVLPALQRGAREAVVVLFAPVVQGLPALPTSLKQEIEWVFELASLGSAESLISLLLTLQGKPILREVEKGGAITVGRTRLLPVAPNQPLGMHSLLHWGEMQTEELFEAGYRDACNQLVDLLEHREK